MKGLKACVKYLHGAVYAVFPCLQANGKAGRRRSQVSIVGLRLAAWRLET